MSFEFDRWPSLYSFQDPFLYAQAITHPSHRASFPLQHSRLTFLGQHILQSLLADLLALQHTQLKYHDLDHTLSYLMATQSCARVSEAIGLAQRIRVDVETERVLQCEDVYSQEQRLHVLTGSFFALVGAIYLDSGRDFDLCRRVIAAWFDPVVRALPSPAGAVAQSKSISGWSSPFSCKSLDTAMEEPGLIPMNRRPDERGDNWELDRSVVSPLQPSTCLNLNPSSVQSLPEVDKPQIVEKQNQVDKPQIVEKQNQVDKPQIVEKQNQVDKPQIVEKQNQENKPEIVEKQNQLKNKTQASGKKKQRKEVQMDRHTLHNWTQVARFSAPVYEYLGITESKNEKGVPIMLHEMRLHIPELKEKCGSIKAVALSKKAAAQDAARRFLKLLRTTGLKK